MATAKKKAVTVKGSTDVAQRQSLDAFLDATAGQGLEEASRDAFTTPLLRILQDLSPQTKKTKAEYIPGAKPGMIFNTATKEVYERIVVLPCYFTETYIEWIPRDDGGGLVAVHPKDTALIHQTTRDGSKQVLPNGHELALTHSQFVVRMKDEGGAEACVIPMSSTNLKLSKNWNTQQLASKQPTVERQRGYATYHWMYELGSQEVSNAKGTWYQWVIGPREQCLNIEALQAAQAFYSMLRSGAAQKVDYAAMSDPIDAKVSDAPNDLDNEIDA